MLVGLAISDLVLIDRLDLEFDGGLSVLTGETGAGKSILLDALGLALGARSEAGLVRQGAGVASVTASFELPHGHPARAILAEVESEAGAGSPGAETLLLRRTVAADGRSRSYIDDVPVSAGLLRRVGAALVEIQGQFDQHGLLYPATHRGLLDAFMAEPERLHPVQCSYAAWRKAKQTLDAAERETAQSLALEAELRHSLAELDAADPKPGEEAELAGRRVFLMHRAQFLEAATLAAGEIAGERGALRALHAAARLLEKIRDKAGGRLDPAAAALERATIEAEEAGQLLATLLAGESADGDRLDQVEERLFELRALARKHGIGVEDLAVLQRDVASRLAALDAGGEAVRALRLEEARMRTAFEAAVALLSAARREAAARLEAAVMAELPALKLDRARFAVRLDPLEPSRWGGEGGEDVAFEVATNPGAAAGPLGRIASAGELSRLLLALKLALAQVSAVPTLVFDEVDSGIGGATAAAVGERLQLLGRNVQVLVVTHSPQVAALGGHHWRVSKAVVGADGVEHTRISVEKLRPEARREEIARMLAGAEITAEARAAADRLLGAARPARAKKQNQLDLGVT